METICSRFVTKLLDISMSYFMSRIPESRTHATVDFLNVMHLLHTHAPFLKNETNGNFVHSLNLEIFIAFLDRISNQSNLKYFIVIVRSPYNSSRFEEFFQSFQHHQDTHIRWLMVDRPVFTSTDSQTIPGHLVHLAEHGVDDALCHTLEKHFNFFRISLDQGIEFEQAVQYGLDNLFPKINVHLFDFQGYRNLSLCLSDEDMRTLLYYFWN